jgi:hypothetical protein
MIFRLINITFYPRSRLITYDPHDFAMITDLDEEPRFHNFLCVWCGESGALMLPGRKGVGFTCPGCDAVYAQVGPKLNLEWISMPSIEEGTGILELEECAND